MSDDFMASSGLVEGTAAAFANTWKTSASCSDITLTFGHPCSLSFNKGTASLSSRDLYIINWSVLQWKFGWSQSISFHNQSFFFLIRELCRVLVLQANRCQWSVFSVSLYHQSREIQSRKPVYTIVQIEYHTHQCLQKCDFWYEVQALIISAFTRR